MKNNWLDHVGHSRGYYTDDYWGEVKELDESQKAAEEKRIKSKLRYYSRCPAPRCRASGQ